MKHSRTILLVDDEDGFRENVAEHLQAREYKVLEASEAESALAQVRERLVDAALVDILMPGMDGIALLDRLNEVDPLMEVVIVTGQGSIESAVEAMRRGAYHYVTKPVRLSELEMVLRRAIEKGHLARQNLVYREDLRRRDARSTTEIIACSSAMKSILAEAERIAETDSTVLIEGETGAGKEMVAEFIHRRSLRRSQTFSVLNCGALAESLLDAELFGYEKGAFTGAVETRPGIFEVSDGGTLLLDEIGDLSLAAQVRLLRVLERGLFRKVGSMREQVVDVRVLAATHQNLAQEVEGKRFREDLYHRLNVFHLRIPPLWQRPDDILLLSEHFAAKFAARAGASLAISNEARNALQAYSWPGNVRELAHAIERACFAARLADTDEITGEQLRLPVSTRSEGVLVSLEENQKRHIESVLAHLDGNRHRAAKVLGISERHLYRLLQKFHAEVTCPQP